MRISLRLAVSFLGVFGAVMFSTVGSAATGDTPKRDPSLAPTRGQYVYDSFGRESRASLVGNCIYTGQWTPQDATPACDPDLFAAAPKQTQTAQAKAATKQSLAKAGTTGATGSTGSTGSQGASGLPVTAKSAASSSIAAVPGTRGNRVSGSTSALPGETTQPSTREGILARRVYNTGAGTESSELANAAQSANGQVQNGASTGSANVGANNTYQEEKGAPNESGIIGQSRYYQEENGAPKASGILGQNRYYPEENGAPKTSGIIGQSRYYQEENGAPSSSGITVTRQFGTGQGNANGESPTAGQQLAGGGAAGQTQGAAMGGQTGGVGTTPTMPEEGASSSAMSKQEIARAEESNTQSGTEMPRPVTILPVTITVEAEPLFDFNRYGIRSDSQTKLDQLAKELKDVNYGQIVAVGYADPIGTAMYNQLLSERRAMAVKAYLAQLGIATERIQVEGRGETEEFASYEACGGLRTAKTISCLQPDRRVEVTVNARKQN